MFKAVVIVMAASFLMVSYAPPAEAGVKDTFTTLKCTKCHTVKSKSIVQAPPAEGKKAKRSTDLSRVGSKHDKAWIKGWMQRTVFKTKTKKDGTTKEKKHRVKFKGSAGQLATLVNWMAKLK